MITRNDSAGKCLRASLGVCFLLSGTILPAAPAADWSQWGQNAQHNGASPVLGQPLSAILADIEYDPFVEQMKAESGGTLLAHYAVALVDADGAVYMVFKSGTYTGFGNFDSQTWSVKKLVWSGGTLQVLWTFQSDWKPEPIALTNWESVFLPVLSGESVYVPGSGGSVYRVSKTTGTGVRINPFASVDPSVYVAGGLAAAPDGSVLYDVVGLATPDPRAGVLGAWLVRIAANGAVSTASFAALVPGAPGANDQCVGTFSQDELPWPPSPTAVPPSGPCGLQRPGINVVPAIAPDGTIYTLSRAHANDRYSYLVAVHPDLTPAWSASLRGILNDGCGVLLENDGSTIGCRSNAPTGVDPATNDRPAGRVRDQGTSSPVVLPDGSVLIGASTSYNFSRGHLFKFSSSGDALATYDFGWDITPAVFAHDGTYSILLKDNHYFDSDGDAYYDVSSLDANLAAEWSFRSTNTESCQRQPGGAIVCVDDHPEGFEWCVNQPAVDAAGTVYLNSEDGNLFAFDRAGQVVGHIFLDTALGAAYTPVSLGGDGHVYAQNNGHLFVVGFRASVRETPDPLPDRPHSPRVVDRP
jgi:hypothetical protein